MSSTQNAPIHQDEGLVENNGIGVDVSPINPEGVPNVEPIDISSHNALNTNAGTDLVRNAHREARPDGQRTRGMEEGGVSLQVIFEMLQVQQVSIAQLQSKNRTPNTVEPVNRRPVEPALERPDKSGSETDPTIMKILEELAKRIDTIEKNIEEIDKKVETYNSMVDQIPGAPPILEGLDSKKFVQRPFPSSAAPKPISKKFHMPEIPKYNGTTDPNEHVTSYTCAIKGNDLEDDEVESVLLKKFGETLSKDSFVKAHTEAIKIAMKKLDLFKTIDRIKNKSVKAVRKILNVTNDYTEEEEAKVYEENKWAFEENVMNLLISLCL
uniref:Uncharacterized protein LOC104234641 n=1 Tax=Nicotiana sylvestris TaxID=4096 RepID=A0A1U7XHX3_NICSY|nr:PREDICTED: uncharacterized protein LOC104234641 [Nicotiana sylvestris]